MVRIPDTVPPRNAALRAFVEKVLDPGLIARELAVLFVPSRPWESLSVQGRRNFVGKALELRGNILQWAEGLMDEEASHD